MLKNEINKTNDLLNCNKNDDDVEWSVSIEKLRLYRIMYS